MPDPAGERGDPGRPAGPARRPHGVKVLYATQAATDPPTFTLFANREVPADLPPLPRAQPPRGLRPRRHAHQDAGPQALLSGTAARSAHDRGEAVELLVGRDVVDAGPHDVVEPAVGEVELGRGRAWRHAHVDALGAAAGPAPSSRSTPSTVKVVMAQSCAPRSWTVTPGDLGQPVAEAVGQPGVALGDGVDAPAEGVVDGHPEPDAAGDVGLPHLEAAGVRRGSRSGRAPSTCAACRSSIDRLEPRDQLAGARRGTRCPAGPRRNLRPLPARTPQPELARRRAAAGPTDWQASSTKSTPASRHSRPTSAAGFTSPPWVGTWTRRHERGVVRGQRPLERRRGRSGRASSSSTSTSWQPVRRWSCRSAMALAPYSARLISTRSCGSMRQRVHGHVPGPGGGVDQRDLVGVGADELGERGVGALEPAARPARRPRSRRSSPRAGGGRRRRRARAGGAARRPAWLRWSTCSHPGVSARAAVHVELGTGRSPTDLTVCQTPPHAAERARLRVLRRGQAAPRSSSTSTGASTGAGPNLRAVHEGTGPRPAPDRAGLQGAAARDHLRRRPGLGQLQPAQVPALLELPEPGRGVDRRRVPLLRRLRARVGRHLEDAAVPGQGAHPARATARAASAPIELARPRRRGHARPTASSCTSAPRRGTGTTTTSSTSATR